MRRYRLLAALVGGATLLAACTTGGSSSGGAYGGGGYGAAPTSQPSPAASTVGAASSATSGGYGGGKSDYGPGGGSSVAVASAVPGVVRLSGYAFQPATVMAAGGSTLTFANDDSVAHDIVIGSGGTPTDPAGPHAKVGPGSSGSLVMPTAGTVELTCTIHPSMTMTVTVTP